LKKISYKRRFLCDESMVKGILRLNKLGFYTIGCCSGLKIDHPDSEREILYVEFEGLNSDKRAEVFLNARELGFAIKKGGMNRKIRIEAENDDKIEMFASFVKAIKRKEKKLELRAIGLSNWAYDPETKKKYSVQFYDYDYNGDSHRIPRSDLLRILEIFPYDCLMYETKQGVHFISFSILLGLNVAKARVLKLTKGLKGQDYWTEAKDLTLRVSGKWKTKRLKKREIASKKPKFKGLIKGPDNLIKKYNPILKSKNPDKYVISKNHLEFYKKYMNLPDWVYKLYTDCDKRDLKIKIYHYKTGD